MAGFKNARRFSAVRRKCRLLIHQLGVRVHVQGQADEITFVPERDVIYSLIRLTFVGKQLP